MSLRAFTLALEHPCCPSPSAKLVLMVFANYVDSRGCAWPSLQTVERITGLNLKTVRRSIASLIDAGIIRETGERKGATQQVKVYELLLERVPEMEAFPDRDRSNAPEEQQDGATAAQPESLPKQAPLKTATFSAKASQIRDAEPVTGTITPKDPAGSLSPEGRKTGRRSTISEEWSPPPIAELPDRIRTIAEQWPAGAYEAQAEAHRAYRAAGRARRDWTSDWHARIVQLGAQPMRDAKAGMTFAPAVATAAPSQPTTVPIEFAKPDEIGQLGEWRQAAAATIGDASYRRLLDPAHLEMDSEQLIIIVDNPVAEMQLRADFEHRLVPLVRRVLDRRLLRLQVGQRAA
jgi:hypothetical protein